MYSYTAEVGIWILNHTVGKARVVWPRSGSDILIDSMTISKTNRRLLWLKSRKRNLHILDDSNIAVGIYGAHRLRRYEDELSAYRTSCGNDLRRRGAIYLAFTSGEVVCLVAGAI